MATTFTDRAGLAKPASADTGWGTTVNAGLTDRLESYEAVGGLCVRQAEYPSTTLNVNVGAGAYEDMNGVRATYAGTTGQAVTDDADTYLWLNTSGVLTTGASLPAAACVPLAKVTAASGVITAIDDLRPVFRMTVNAAQSALTAADGGTINSGDATTDAVIGNMRTRQAEIEARLQALRLIP